MATKIFGVELNRPTSGRATAVAVIFTVSMLWAYVTSLFGVRVTDGWRSWAIYVAGLVVFNAIAGAVLVATN